MVCYFSLVLWLLRCTAQSRCVYNMGTNSAKWLISGQSPSMQHFNHLRVSLQFESEMFPIWCCCLRVGVFEARLAGRGWSHWVGLQKSSQLLSSGVPLLPAVLTCTQLPSQPLFTMLPHPGWTETLWKCKTKETLSWVIFLRCFVTGTPK